MTGKTKRRGAPVYALAFLIPTGVFLWACASLGILIKVIVFMWIP